MTGLVKKPALVISIVLVVALYAVVSVKVTVSFSIVYLNLSIVKSNSSGWLFCTINFNWNCLKVLLPACYVWKPSLTAEPINWDISTLPLA